MNLPVLKDFNLLRLSGIKDIIIVEIMPEKARIIAAERKEFFAKVNNGDVHQSINILNNVTCSLDDDFLVLKGEIADIIKKNSLKDPVIIAGLSEFRQTIAAIPLDTEDIDLWFLENSGKFLPEGRPRHEFTYSYELLRKDEGSSYYNVVVVRSDYIKRLEEALNISQARLFAIYPFPVSLHLNMFARDNSVLLLQISKDRLFYSAVNAEKHYLFGEIYNDFIHEGRINHKALSSSLNELKGILAPLIKGESSGAQNAERFKVLLAADEADFAGMETIVRSVFINEVINNDFKDPALIVPLIGLNLVFNNADSGLNLIEDNEKVRFSIEKQLTMRAVLSAGMVMIVFLVSLFIMETILSSKFQELEENQADITSKTGQVEQMQKENRYLKMNLELINSLKGGRAKYTSLMNDMTKVVSDKSSLTGINFKTGDAAYIACEISGTAFSQEEVAEVVGRIEKIKSFKNVSLLFAGYKDRQSSFENYNDNKSKMIHFNISARYNAD